MNNPNSASAADFPAASCSQSVLLHQVGGDELLTAETLAPLLNLSRTTVEAAATRRPDRLPPPVLIPGGRRMWLRSTVFAWLKSLEVGTAAPVAVAAELAKRGRGRPRKIVAGVQS